MLSKTIGMKTRSAARQKTRIYGTVKYYHQQAKGRVVDLSATGMALDLGGPFHAANGSPVKIESEELGILEGTVKWCHRGRLGIQFRPNSNAAAQVSSYFRFFHKEIRPVIAR
ncbi:MULTISPECIES: PilZ domain-containing protein [Rhizobium/Agrobacterium group]|jgi:hypothetical protein|uniref:PilZ domain-containing protein n=1 Tax=Neorhizobium petrolearium TaxID=515361 RepID=A0ABY8M605_9HYPH|nr:MULTISPECIES: PilZ domain-containing protein [Rhizobium/Agrobacterium group]KGE01951.1 pilus assembly protein PilZ [Rhizobium sp. YS-1r]MCC2609747.1 PilZ domain-containing protein [Neorhizobium petrolearium]WGI69938.1 PilZ domain-containing protein [Neorhizobium petrolearium]